MGIKLRQRKQKSGCTSLYLDIYHNGKRKYEFLPFQLVETKTPLDRQMNKENYRLAEEICSKRKLELFSNGYGVVPSHKRKISFLDYYKKVAETKNGSTKERWFSSIQMIRPYLGDNLQITAINKEWLIGLRKLPA